MSIPGLSCSCALPMDHISFPTQSHRRKLLYLLDFRKEQMNARQERRGDPSSQTEQQEKILTPKKHHFYIFPGEFKRQSLSPSPQELRVLWSFCMNSALRTVVCY